MPSAVIGSLLMLSMTVAMMGMVLNTANELAGALELQAKANACVIRGQVAGNFTTYWNGAVCTEVFRPSCIGRTPSAASEPLSPPWALPEPGRAWQARC